MSNKTLVLITSALLLIVAWGAPLFLKADLPPAIELNTDGQPTIGYVDAPIHIVVFEEPKCTNCRLFNEKIYPQIKEAYIDTKKATYTVIPVSFLPGSMPAAVALLCVYHTDPLHPDAELYFSYLDYLYENQPGESVDWATPATLVKYGKATSPTISGGALEQCVIKLSYKERVEQNTRYGTQLMGGHIATPTVYVNGVEAKELSFDAISELIDEVKAND